MLKISFWLMNTTLFFCCFSYAEPTRLHSRNDTVPLEGRVLHFSDPYGPCSFETRIIHYETSDKARIEATLLVPNTNQKSPGLIFVHMWARNRHTFWGLPEYLASYGYPGIYMDLRGHGNSKLPDSDKRITIDDCNFGYANFYLDILPAIELLNENERVEPDELILIGASLGCPLGVLAADQYREKFIGMVHLTPSISYFDVHCGDALDRMRRLPTFVFAEKTDPAYESSKRFFEIPRGYKTFMEQEYAGHGTDILYHDIGFPTIILGWIEQIQRLTALRRHPNHTRSSTLNP